jgi:NADH-quinone oxidoreductase subunit B
MIGRPRRVDIEISAVFAGLERREPPRFEIVWGSTFRLSVFDLGLACCAVEFVAATMRAAGLAAAGPPAAGASPPIEVLVVSGTVTDVMAPAVKRRYDALPEPKRVMSFGSCANSGGPYWDSYCVTKGVDQLIPVDVYVPGCPPRPEALLDGLRVLHERARG